MASRLEQFNRIAVGIFNLNLFAARAYLHFIFKTQTRLFRSATRRQILHLKKRTVLASLLNSFSVLIPYWIV